MHEAAGDGLDLERARQTKSNDVLAPRVVLTMTKRRRQCDRRGERRGNDDERVSSWTSWSRMHGHRVAPSRIRCDTVAKLQCG